jgi:hypothetical protein
MTPKIPPSATARMVRPSAVACSIRRRRDAVGVSSGAALDASGSVNVMASSTSDSGRAPDGATTSSTSAVDNTSGGAVASPTSVAGGADTAAAGGGDTAGSVGDALSVSGTVRGEAALAPGTKDFRLPLASSALANSRHRGNLSAGAFMSARPKGASKWINSGFTSPGRGDASLRCLLITTAGFMCANGGDPVRR